MKIMDKAKFDGKGQKKIKSLISTSCASPIEVHIKKYIKPFQRFDKKSCSIPLAKIYFSAPIQKRLSDFQDLETHKKVSLKSKNDKVLKKFDGVKQRVCFYNQSLEVGIDWKQNEELRIGKKKVFGVLNAEELSVGNQRIGLEGGLRFFLHNRFEKVKADLYFERILSLRSQCRHQVLKRRNSNPKEKTQGLSPKDIEIVHF